MPDRYYSSAHYEKMVTFSFANAASIEQVRYIQNQLVDVYRKGGTFRDFKHLARQGQLALGLPDYRLENIFRTNIMTAYARGSYLEQQVSSDYFPWGKYVAILDSATRPNHRALNGLIVEFGSPEFKKIYPPNGYQCRCVMRMLSDKQAERERRFSDAEAKQIIAANPPDPGFEGPPFYGFTPDEMLIPGEMTEEQLLGFLDTGETASYDNYMKYVTELEQSGTNATAEQIKNASLIPDTVVKAKKDQMKFYLDEHIEEAKKELNIDDFIEFTPAEKKLQKKIDKTIAVALHKAGLIAEPTLEAKRAAIKETMFDVFKEMNKSGILQDYTPQQRWDRYLNMDNSEIASNVNPNYLLSERYSGAVMRFLSTEEKVMLSFYTEGGDRFCLYAATQARDSNSFKAMNKYFSTLNHVYGTVERYVERAPVQVYRGFGVEKKWTDKKVPGSKTTLVDVFKKWRTGVQPTFQMELPNSFSDDKDIAQRFMRASGGQRVIFNVASNRAMPITSISPYPEEKEHLMRPGEKYRIVKVRKDKEKYTVDLEHVDQGKEVDYIFSL
jgi:SPP1 gp7 family putative phage head morphogenesis protein